MSVRRNRHLNLGASCAIAAALCSAPTTHADNLDWIGFNGGLWQFPLNWSPSGIPGSDDNVFFNTGVLNDDLKTVTLGGNVTVDRMFVEWDRIDLDLNTFTLTTLYDGGSDSLRVASVGTFSFLKIRNGEVETQNLRMGVLSGSNAGSLEVQNATINALGCTVGAPGVLCLRSGAELNTNNLTANANSEITMLGGSQAHAVFSVSLGLSSQMSCVGAVLSTADLDINGADFHVLSGSDVSAETLGDSTDGSTISISQSEMTVTGLTILRSGSEGKHAVSVQNNSTLTTGTTLLSGVIDNAAGFLVSGNSAWHTDDLELGGLLPHDTCMHVESGSTLTSTELTIGASIIEYPGHLAAQNPGTQVIVDGVTDVIAGSLTIDDDAHCAANGGLFLEPAGEVNLAGGRLSGLFFSPAGGTFNFTGGMLSVDNFNDDLAHAAGTVAPGTSAGITVVQGLYSPAADAMLEIELFGTGEFGDSPLAGVDYDRLHAHNAVLGGTLKIVVDDDYQPQLGDSFSAVVFARDDGVVTGAFDSIVGAIINDELMFEVQYCDNCVSLEVVAIPVPCSEDLSGDGTVDTVDLLSLLGDWGMCKGCAADLSGDGVVDTVDLLQLLGAWGGCE